MHAHAVHALHVRFLRLMRLSPITLAAQQYRTDRSLPFARQSSTIRKNVYRLQHLHRLTICKSVANLLTNDASKEPFVAQSSVQVANHLKSSQPMTPLGRVLRPNSSMYLQCDDRLTVCHRARLRFDMALLNSSAHHRKLTATPTCLCSKSLETVEHFLMDCKLYSSQRDLLSAALRALHPPVMITSDIILGAVDSMPLPAAKRILLQTGLFIASLHSARRF